MDLDEIDRDDEVSLIQEEMILREAGRRRKAEMAAIKAQVIATSPIEPDKRISLTSAILDEVCSALTPWDVDTRSHAEMEQDEDKRLEDFYYRAIEAYEEQKKIIEEIENERQS